MATTLPNEVAAMGFQMPDQVNPLHAAILGRQSLADHLSASQVLFGQRPIGFEY